MKIIQEAVRLEKCNKIIVITPKIVAFFAKMRKFNKIDRLEMQKERQLKSLRFI